MSATVRRLEAHCLSAPEKQFRQQRYWIDGPARLRASQAARSTMSDAASVFTTGVIRAPLVRHPMRRPELTRRLTAQRQRKRDPCVPLRASVIRKIAVLRTTCLRPSCARRGPRVPPRGMKIVRPQARACRPSIEERGARRAPNPQRRLLMRSHRPSLLSARKGSNAILSVQIDPRT